MLYIPIGPYVICYIHPCVVDEYTGEPFDVVKGFPDKA